MTRKDEFLFQYRYTRDVIEPKFRNVHTPVKFYPSVRKIGGNDLLNELDLLAVENEKVVWGYEFKYLKQKSMSNNYKSLYAGLGQLLTYFYYGINKGVLVVCIKNEVLEKLKKDSNKKDKLSQIIATLSNLITINNPNRVVYSGLPNKDLHINFIGWHIIDEKGNTIYFYDPTETSPYTQNKLIKQDNINILNENFKWDSNFNKKYSN